LLPLLIAFEEFLAIDCKLTKQEIGMMELRQQLNDFFLPWSRIRIVGEIFFPDLGD